MLDYQLTKEEIISLRIAHRKMRDKRAAYRINTVILLATGWSAEQVSQALLIDSDTVRNYFKSYKQGGLEHLLHVNYQGSDAWLDSINLAILELYLSENLASTIQEIINWVLETFDVQYSDSGMTALINRLGFTYKKPTIIPGKADPEKQKSFLKKYKKLKKIKGKDDVIYFMDAVHPQHNTAATRAWIQRGQSFQIPTNTGRDRLNIHGAINIETMDLVVSYEKTINAESTINFLKSIREQSKNSGIIWLICDNARYHHAKILKSTLKEMKIKLLFLPAYAPNLNVIERLWKFFKKKITNNQYYETFKEFKSACECFFDNIKDYEPQLRLLLTENFQIIS